VAYLAEVSEDEADGRLAAVYDDIRTAVGFVNLVYRHLAALDRLEGVWERLRPNLVDSAIDVAADELVELASVDVTPLSPAALAACGVRLQDVRRARATLDVYNHANPRNLLALVALTRGVGGRVPVLGGAARRTPGGDLLPAGTPAETDGPAGGLLDELSAAFAAPGEDVVVPGLFRHFAGNPAWLALVSAVVAPLVSGKLIASRANVVRARAIHLADALPHPVEPERDGLVRAAAERFAQTIPAMLVAGLALRRAHGD
jgi:hypothetical protein